MRRRVLSTIAGAAVAVAGAPLGAHAQSPADRRAAVALVGSAVGAVERRVPACRTDPTPSPLPRVDVPVAPVFTSVLGIFRRPSTAEDVDAGEMHSLPPFTAFERNRQGSRLVRSANGVAFVVIASNRAVEPGPDVTTFERCQDLIERELRRRAGTRSAPVRREAARLHDRLRITERPDETRPLEAITVFVRDAPGSATAIGDAFDPQEFARQGMFLAASLARRRSLLAGLVPDGVASIEAIYPRFGLRGPRSVDHGRRLRRRAVVVDNVVALTVPRPPDAALPALMLWRDASGSVVRVVG